jgi:hypothetical protein
MCVHRVTRYIIEARVPENTYLRTASVQGVTQHSTKQHKTDIGMAAQQDTHTCVCQNSISALCTARHHQQA